MTTFSADARAFLQFFHGQSWRVSGELSTSYVEIEPAAATFVDVLKIVRKACTLAFSCEGQSLIPGTHHATWAHKCGHALPKGSVMGSRIYMSNNDFCSFATIVSMGVDRI